MLSQITFQKDFLKKEKRSQLIFWQFTDSQIHEVSVNDVGKEARFSHPGPVRRIELFQYYLQSSAWNIVLCIFC